jgi:hypothetical protein
MAVFYVIPLTKATTKEVYNPLLNGKERLINEARVGVAVRVSLSVAVARGGGWWVMTREWAVGSPQPHMARHARDASWAPRCVTRGPATAGSGAPARARRTVFRVPRAPRSASGAGPSGNRNSIK